MTKLHFQLCIALFCLLLVFMVGIDRNENEVVCTAMSALIQYFTLAVVLWMGAEAVLMFQKLIIVFGNITVKYFVIVPLICWRKFLTSKDLGVHSFFHCTCNFRFYQVICCFGLSDFSWYGQYFCPSKIVQW